jgi:hypothetical protein
VTVLEFLTELSRAAITGDAARAGSRADGDAAGESLDSLPAAGDGDRYGST